VPGGHGTSITKPKPGAASNFLQTKKKCRFRPLLSLSEFRHPLVSLLPWREFGMVHDASSNSSCNVQLAAGGVPMPVPGSVASAAQHRNSNANAQSQELSASGFG